VVYPHYYYYFAKAPAAFDIFNFDSYKILTASDLFGSKVVSAFAPLNVQGKPEYFNNGKANT
jgi:hypothetical protein